MNFCSWLYMDIFSSFAENILIKILRKMLPLDSYMRTRTVFSNLMYVHISIISFWILFGKNKFKNTKNSQKYWFCLTAWAANEFSREGKFSSFAGRILIEIPKKIFILHSNMVTRILFLNSNTWTHSTFRYYFVIKQF